MLALPEAVRRALEETGGSFELLECDPALADTAQFCAQYGYPPERAANTILVASKRPAGHFSASVVLATKRLDVNKKVKDLMGVKRLSFASDDQTRDVTGMELGAVTPFGLPSDLPLYVDSLVLEPDYVIMGAGTRAAKIKADPASLRRLEAASVVENLAVPIPAA